MAFHRRRFNRYRLPYRLLSNHTTRALLSLKTLNHLFDDDVRDLLQCTQLSGHKVCARSLLAGVGSALAYVNTSYIFAVIGRMCRSAVDLLILISVPERSRTVMVTRANRPAPNTDALFVNECCRFSRN